MPFIELLFFAYRDFISDPDAVLVSYGFGRAHHRVVHFVNRHPGIRVADLLDILKITKQSLGRVLKQLVDTGFIEQRPGSGRPPPAPALPDRGRPRARAPPARPAGAAHRRRACRAVAGRARRRRALPDADHRCRRARQGRPPDRPLSGSMVMAEPATDTPLTDDRAAPPRRRRRHAHPRPALALSRRPRLPRHQRRRCRGGAPAARRPRPSICSSST